MLNYINRDKNVIFIIKSTKDDKTGKPDYNILIENIVVHCIFDNQNGDFLSPLMYI